jgi:hypothetical protein
VAISVDRILNLRMTSALRKRSARHVTKA